MVEIDLLVEAHPMLGDEIAEPLVCTHQSRQVCQDDEPEDFMDDVLGEVQERQHGGKP